MNWLQTYNPTRQHRLIFYGIFLLLQWSLAGTAGLMDDETYYWMYAQYPAVGYFDHPPMIAWLIKLGTLLFGGSLGVRFMVVLLSVGTLWLIERMTKPKDPVLLYTIFLSIALLQIGGILAVPDIPLLFFTAVFFYAYQQFLRKENIWSALGLGISMALLLWSKYHGILIIFFTFLSNPSLALRKWAWFAVLLGVALFFPHLRWQYQHDFPSVQFHLFERNEPAYKIKFTLEYVLGQLVLLGPFIAWLIWWAASKNRAQAPFERALRFCFWGIYLFFLASSLKGRVEANWTLPVLVPTLILGQSVLENDNSAKKWIFRLFIPAILITTVVRIYMMQDQVKLTFIKKDELHQNEIAMKQIDALAGNHPVVFINSYQLASKFQFYQGKPAFSMNEVFYRRNNYNFWPLENPVQGKRVLVLKGGRDLPDGVLQTPRGELSYAWVDPYYSFSQVDVQLGSGRKIIGKTSQSIQIDVLIDCPDHSITPLKTAIPKEELKLFVFNLDDKITDTVYTGVLLSSLQAGKQSRSFTWTPSLPAGKYFAKFAMPTSMPAYHSLNSGILAVELEK